MISWIELAAATPEVPLGPTQGWHYVVIVLAGLWAGLINIVVGSGTLVTFPVLLAVGVPPVAANISNNLGLVPGGIAGSWGYRNELRSTWPALRRLLPWTALGTTLGAGLLRVLPSETFAVVVPVLIVVALGLVIGGPQLQRYLAARKSAQAAQPAAVGVGVLVAVFGCGVYGGYFGAAQGVLLLGILGVGTPYALQRVNAVKNVLVTFSNALAAVIFVLFAWEHILWPVVGLLSAGSLVGGWLGAKVGRRLPPEVLRAVIVAVGLVALWKLLG